MTTEKADPKIEKTMQNIEGMVERMLDGFTARLGDMQVLFQYNFVCVAKYKTKTGDKHIARYTAGVNTIDHDELDELYQRVLAHRAKWEADEEAKDEDDNG